MKVSLSIALKLSVFARFAKRVCGSGDEVKVSFPRFEAGAHVVLCFF